jgi:outer membrane protein, multidrug efflux system
MLCTKVLQAALVCSLLVGLQAAPAADPQNKPQANWWTVYGDEELNRLVEQAQQRNLDVKKAAQRVAEARAITGDARSKLLPSLDLSSSAQRLRGGFQQGIVRIPEGGPAANSGGSFVAPFETGIFSGGTQTRWELDFWGANRQLVRAGQADTVAESELVEDARLLVSAEVARVYMELRGIEDRIAITKSSRDAQKDLLDLTQSRAEAGLASQLDVERQAVLLANTDATIFPLEADRQVRLNRLAVLLDEPAFASRPFPALKSSLAPPKLEGGVSSELLKRRPDVRSAEARIAAAQARVKSARTDLFPKFTLTGSAGRQSTSVTGLSLGGGNFFSIGPQLSLPIFSGGRIRSNIAANESRFEQSRTTYEQEMLTAFEEAENAIAAYKNQQLRADRLQAALDAARRSLEMSTDLNRAGLESYLTVLDAQRSLLDAEYQLSEARTRTLVESVQLYKALAGGWPQ